MAEKKKYTLMNTVAVLSVSTLLYLATINASSLAYMVKEFPQYGCHYRKAVLHHPVPYDDRLLSDVR